MLNFKKFFTILSLLLLSFTFSACSSNSDLESRIKILEDKIAKLEVTIETQNSKANEYYTKQLELQKQAEEESAKLLAPREEPLDYNRPSKIK